nr:hypothetical protein GCM10020093_055490 [Planobispora longispora]
MECDAKAVRTIRANVAALGLPGAELAADKVERVLARGAAEPYDFVFADPPYAVTAEEVDAVLGQLRDHGWLAEDALIAVERESRGKDLVWPRGSKRRGSVVTGKRPFGTVAPPGIRKPGGSPCDALSARGPSTPSPTAIWTSSAGLPGSTTRLS